MGATQVFFPEKIASAARSVEARTCAHGDPVERESVSSRSSATGWTWHEKASAERGRRGWSVSEVARRMEGDGRGTVDPQQLRKYLKGVHAPRHETVARIGRVFGWPPGYIEDEAMPYPPTTHDAYLELTVRNLDANGRKVLAALSDAACAEYLARAVDQFQSLRERMWRMTPQQRRDGDAT